MTSWYSITYRCKVCGAEKDDLIDRELKDIPIPCDECDGEMTRKLFACITRESWPDGVTKRWAKQKEIRSLERDMRKVRVHQRVHGISPKMENEYIRLKKERHRVSNPNPQK